jgi:hypothetical protein
MRNHAAGPRRARTAATSSLPPQFVESLESRTLLSTYYVSPLGSDTNTGTSTSSPWQTLAKASSKAFKAGDQILLQGGQTFAGTLRFESNDKGNSTRPSKSRPTAPAGHDRRRHRRGAWSSQHGRPVVSNPERRRVRARRRTRGRDRRLTTTWRRNTKLKYLRFDNVSVSGFGWYGLNLGGGYGTSGVRRRAG